MTTCKDKDILHLFFATLALFSYTARGVGLSHRLPHSARGRCHLHAHLFSNMVVIADICLRLVIHKRLALFPCARQVTSTRPRLGVVFRYSVLDILRVLFEEKLTEGNASSTPSREVICSLTRHVSP
jgi:hypothetical protein